MNQEKITSFITELRKEKHLTQQEFADILGVSNSAVSKWESGKYLPDSTLYEKIAECFNISISELLAGKKEEKKSNYKTIILSLLVIFLLILNAVSLSKYFQEKKNTNATYRLVVSNDNVILNGFLIKNKETSYLIISELSLLQPPGINNIKDISIYLKTNEETIIKIKRDEYSDDLTKSFNNNLLSINNIDLDELLLEINYFNGLKEVNNSSKVNIISIDNNKK